jgi:CMP-2-keto-3-deoxyoctulosonic acid synthetase
MGINVRMIMIEGSPMAVDTEEDLKKANELAMELNPNLWK